MKKQSLRVLTTALSVLCILIFAASLQATTRVVAPDGTGEYPTILAAVTASAPGDTVELLPGVFTGVGNREVHIDRALTIRSQGNDPAACAIDVQFAGNSALSIFTSGVVNLAGITFRNSIYYGVWTPDTVIPRGTVANCVFSDNKSTGYSCDSENDCNFTSCVFTRNEVGIAILQRNHGTFTSCLFADNLLGGSFTYNSEAQFYNCVFERNQRGLRFQHSHTPAFYNCIFRDNVNPTGDGAAVYLVHWANPLFDHCLFYRNSAVSGGAVATQFECYPNFESCTLVDNTSTGPGSGIMMGADGELTMRRTIIAFGHGGEAVGNSGSYGGTVFCDDLYGNEGGDYVGYMQTFGPGYWMYEEDPLFCGWPDADFGLDAFSPCAPDNNTCHAQIGALGVECIASSVPDLAGRALQIEGPMPNPSSGAAVMRFATARDRAAGRLDVFDASGRLMATNAIEARGGRGEAAWDGTTLSGAEAPSGVYLMRLSIGGDVVRRPVVRVR